MTKLVVEFLDKHGPGAKPNHWEGPFDKVILNCGALYCHTHNPVEVTRVVTSSQSGGIPSVVVYDPEVHVRTVTVTVELTEAEAEAATREVGRHSNLERNPLWGGYYKFIDAVKEAKK